MHIFKCAGTSFSWALERCFDSNVLYVEPESHNQRLDWRKLHNSPFLDVNTKAITSHLIDLPGQKELAEITVSFVRNPLDRLYSAFLFARDRQKRFLDTTSFRDYIELHRSSIIPNFMTRHLSPQSWKSPCPGRNGWDLRLDLIDLDRDDLFVGTVERFDEAMVLLEHELEKIGHKVDLSYPCPLNARKSKTESENRSNIPSEGEAWLEPAIEVDRVLVEKANKTLDKKRMNCVGFENRLADYNERCLSLANDTETTSKVRVKPNHEWKYIS